MNTANDTITFASPDDFQTGDADPDRHPGQPDRRRPSALPTYYVRTINDTTIQLTASLAAALAQPDEVTPSDYDSTTG